VKIHLGFDLTYEFAHPTPMISLGQKIKAPSYGTHDRVAQDRA